VLRHLVAFVLLGLGPACRLLVAQEEDAREEHDSSAGLPKEYAGTYLIASGTLSPDQKMAVIYPKEEDEKSKDYSVALKPFRILAPKVTRIFGGKRKDD
jgi:hypothetical protein